MRKRAPSLWVMHVIEKKPGTTTHRLPVLAAAIVSLGASAVFAEPGHHDEHGRGGKGHGAHVHGAAELTLALEGNDLELAFTSPANSVVGFEFRAETPAQREAVATAERQLNAVVTWLTFIGTTCQLTVADVDLSAVKALEPGGKNGHDDGTEHGHEDDAHHEDETHTDVSAHYRYVCDEGARLQSLRVGSDGLPFGLEKIDVMWVTDVTQGATVLTKDSQTIELN